MLNRNCIGLIMAIAVLLSLPILSAAQKADSSAVVPITVEATICTGIEERIPVGVVDTVSADVGQVYCWSKVLGAVDTAFVKHTWLHHDSLIAEVELPVRSSSWRTWSSKKILPLWLGNWEVRILDAEGNILNSATFIVIPTDSL